ncbi:mortality factor 4-like protein 1 isoform 2-T2 [Cariama cristata]
MAPKQDPKPKFQEGERVLCFHGPLLYEAKCVKVAIKDKQVKYFIHYSGWNKNWDEWVPESRVLKYVDTNLQKQKELQKANQEQYAEGKMRGAAPGKKTSGLQQKNVEVFFRRDGAHTVCCLETPTISTRKTKKNKQKTPGIGEGSSTSETPQPPRKKRARVDPTVESEETFMNRVEVKVKIPEELKPWLVDDWDLITRQKQLFYLPAKKNVDSILEDYANYKKSRGNTDNKEYAVNEVVAGIKEYFNVMLGTQLLYKFERPQYAEILADHPDAPMSQVYGAPHLLRLFVRIGAMLAYTPLDEKSLALLLNYLHDFLKKPQDLRTALPRGWSGAIGCEHALTAGDRGTVLCCCCAHALPQTRGAPFQSSCLRVKTGMGWAQGRCEQAQILGACPLSLSGATKSSWKCFLLLGVQRDVITSLGQLMELEKRSLCTPSLLHIFWRLRRSKPGWQRRVSRAERGGRD